MNITDFSNGKIWAIRANALEAMLQQLPEHDALVKSAARFTDRPTERDDFRLVNGVAIIPVTGTITKRGSFFSFLYGGTPLDQLTDIYLDALDDRDVQAILLDMDSPGGTVSGTEAFADLIYSTRGRKPVVAFGNGMMASAAYWIGSGADQVIIESTCDVGSIGVVMVHYDWSKEDEQIGLKRTVLTAGKYKGLGNDAEPLSELARETFQAELDYLYTIFVDTIARNRNVSAETVLSDMADGRIFIGQQAVDAGLADQVGSIDDAIAAAAAMVDGNTSYYFKTGASSVAGKEYKMEIKTAAQLEEQFPDLVVEVRDAAVAGVDLDAARTEAAETERRRIIGLAMIQFGDDAGEKFQAIVESGVTVDQFRAVSAISGSGQSADESNPDAESDEEKAAREAALTAIHAAGADNPGSGGGTDADGEQDFMALVDDYQAAKKCSRTDALKAVASKHPELQKQFLEKVNPQGSA